MCSSPFKGEVRRGIRRGMGLCDGVVLGRPPQFEVMEESPTWGKRLEMMNSAKNYCKKNNTPAPDFSELSSELIDAKLKDILTSIDSINKGKTNRTP